MKVLWTMDYSMTRDGHLGGGVFSTKLLVRGLRALGHVIDAVSPVRKESPLPWYMARVLIGRKFARSLRRDLEHSPPDVVIAQNDTYPYVVQEARRHGIPTVVVARDTRYRCPQPPSWNDGRGGCMKGCVLCVGKHALLPYPWFRYHINMMREGIRMSDAQVVPSTYIANDMRTFILRSGPEVIYPPVDGSHIPEDWEPRDVLFLGKGAYKGADIVADIAEEMQGNGIRFRVCGNQDPSHVLRFKALDNVDLLGFVDQCEAFRTAKVVLAPARWEEPAARNVCEAVSMGVPCIISDRGGVRETMGPGGIVVTDLNDIDEWVSHIEAFYENGSLWDECSRLGKEHSKMMELDRMSKRLEEVLESVRSGQDV